MLDLTRIECFFVHIHNEHILIISLSALEKIQAVSEITNMNNFRIEDELFTGIFRHKAGIDRIGIYPDIVQAMLKDKPVHGAKDYQVGLKSQNLLPLHKYPCCIQHFKPKKDRMRQRKELLRNIIWHRSDQSWSQNWTILDNQAMNFQPVFKLRKQSKASVVKIADKARIKRQKATLASKRHFQGKT